jgi:hypothetical protein
VREEEVRGREEVRAIYSEREGWATCRWVREGEATCGEREVGEGGVEGVGLHLIIFYKVMGSFR